MVAISGWVYSICGYTNNCIVTEKGYPYTWGCNINGRCGIKLSNRINELEDQDAFDSEDEDLHEKYKTDDRIIQFPERVQDLIKILKKNTKEEERFKIKNPDDDEDDLDDEVDDNSESDQDAKVKQLKFDVQQKLKETKSVLNEKDLRMRDQTLKSKLNTLIQRINENVQSLKFDRDHEFFVTETVIITSLYK